MWNLYNDSDIAVPRHKVLPTDSPLISWSNQLSVQLENGTGFPYTPHHAVPDWVMRDQRHAYYASISYVDEHIGAILSALIDSGLSDSTLVVMHADHGYSLGEHGYWEKKSNFDLIVRVPLLIHAPWITKSQGMKTSALVELIDVFPTIVTLAGLPAPSHIDGVDRSVLLSDPTGRGAEAAYHQYPACGCKWDGSDAGARQCYNSTRKACNNTPKNEFDFMGYSMRSDTARYTAWFPWNQTALRAEFTRPYAAELYTHNNDDSTSMDDFENANVAAVETTLAASMHAKLVAFFQEFERKDRRARRERVGTVVRDASLADRSDPYDN
jgi:iduronate 2-sulfatase